MTSSVLTRKVEEFEARIWSEAAGPRHAGKPTLDGAAMVRIVLDDPEVAELYVRSIIDAGVRSSFQVASIIAAILAEHAGDESLLRLIEAEGAIVAPPQLITIPAVPDEAIPDLEESGPVTAAEPRAIHLLTVAENELATCDVQRASRLLRSTQPEHLLAARGRIALHFPSAKTDPRPDFAIPEIRQFVSELERNVPHVAWFLFPRPEYEQIRIYFMCLAPASRLKQHLGMWAFVGSIEDLVDVIRPRARAVRDLGERIGVATAPIVRAWMPTFERDAVQAEQLFARVWSS